MPAGAGAVLAQMVSEPVLRTKDVNSLVAMTWPVSASTVVVRRTAVAPLPLRSSDTTCAVVASAPLVGSGECSSRYCSPWSWFACRAR